MRKKIFLILIFLLLHCEKEKPDNTILVCFSLTQLKGTFMDTYTISEMHMKQNSIFIKASGQSPIPSTGIFHTIDVYFSSANLGESWTNTTNSGYAPTTISNPNFTLASGETYLTHSIEANTGWLLTSYNNQIYILKKTTDAGNTWVTLKSFSPKQNTETLIHTLKTITENDAILLLDSSRMYKTTDGLNWNQIEILPNHSYRNMNMYSDQIGFILLESKQDKKKILYKTNNFGSTWLAIHDLKTENYNYASLNSNQLLSYSDKEIYQSKDSGTNWITLDNSFLNYYYMKRITPYMLMCEF